MEHRRSRTHQRLRRRVMPWLLAGLVTVGAFPACRTARCRFERVEIEPLDDAMPRHFGGRRGGIEVGFVSERPEATIEQFPEPPVRVRDVGAGRECRIEDGGIWVRSGVYVSGDGRILVLQEYSGANEWLAFYDASDCGNRGEIDVSGARWSLTGDAVHVGTDCAGDSIETCAVRRSEALDRACLPSSGD